jgi:glycosyltransferase involved in cell wall biosynthesis
MKNKIDLLIPAYNEEATIVASLESVASQKNINDLEVNVLVLVNSSTDKTYELSKEYSLKTNNPSVHIDVVDLGEIRGKAVAVNRGLEMTNAKYVGFVDADAQLSPNTISLTFGSLINEPSLQVTGVMTYPVLESLDKNSLLYEIQRTQQIYREERNSGVPAGAYISFRRAAIDRFPENIGSEDTWLVLTVAKKFGWESIKRVDSEKAFITPPRNWPDYVKQQSRFNRVFDQLLELYPELEETWNLRSGANKGERQRTIQSGSSDGIEKRTLKRLEAEGIPTRRLDDYKTVFKKVFEETSNNSEQARKLINSKGIWDPIVSTKKAYKVKGL